MRYVGRYSRYHVLLPSSSPTPQASYVGSKPYTVWYLSHGRGALVVIRREIWHQQAVCVILMFACLSSTSHAHGSKSGSSGQLELVFHQVRIFWNVQDHLRQIQKAAPGQQVVFAVYVTISCAAPTGVSNLEVAQEVNKTNKMCYQLNSCRLQVARSMHVLMTVIL